MQKINIQIYLGDNADTAISNPLPAGITSYNPFIRWTFPEGLSIRQVRMQIRITNLDNQQLIAIYKSVTTAQQYQIPIGNGLNNKWTGGRCFVQIRVSENLTYGKNLQFEYTSGGQDENQNGYFVIDPTMQMISSNNAVSYAWQRSVDQNVQQDLIYHLQVATSPIFSDLSLIINDTNISGVSTGFINYESLSLPVGNYFFRVRAYDGYDYSDWSIINCFKVKQFNPPVITNLSYQHTYNDNGDVLVSFDIYNSQNDYSSVVLYYCYQNDLTVQYPCILQQTSHMIPNGHNVLTWRTANNANYNSNTLKNKGMDNVNIIQNCNVFLYAFGYYSGSQGQTSYILVNLQNEIYANQISNTNNVNFQYMFRTYFMKVPTYSTYTYTGWNGDYYDSVISDSSLINKKYTKNYQYYVDLKNLLLNSQYKRNNVYYRLVSQLSKTLSVSNYYGWNSGYYQYVVNNYDDLNGVSNINYYNNFITKTHRYGSEKQKYSKQNDVGFRLITKNKSQYSLYVDGRTFRCNDKTQYSISTEQDGASGSADSWVFSSGNSDSKGKTIKVIPSYQKDVCFNPTFPDQMQLKTTSGTTKNNTTFTVSASKVNWHYCTADGDWDFSASQQNSQTKQSKTVYIKVFGGTLADASDNDSNLKELADGTINYKSFYNSVSGYGKMTYPDGKIVFQDNASQPDSAESPQYTMYPNYYGKNGYPIGISQLYWKCVKLDQLYIRKYSIEKGGKQSGTYGYKDFTTKKSNGIYHCYFTDKIVPQVLTLKNNFLCDDKKVQCYKKVSNQKFEKIDTRYKDLPDVLLISLSYNGKQLLEDDLYYTNGNFILPLYFLTYERIYCCSRGKSPQFEFDQQTNKPTPIQQSPFSNVAVPYYVPAKNYVFSANGFNGKQSAFNLCFKMKRDARRYTLGRYYKWKQRQTDEDILKQLNDFKKQYYPDIQTNELTRNIIIGFKYKWRQPSDLLQINEQQYIYVPTYTYNTIVNSNDTSQSTVDYSNGSIKYAWFKNVTKDAYNIDFGDIDNNDYIMWHRDCFGASFLLSNSGFKTVSEYDYKKEGTRFQQYTSSDQRYYSDKSEYGIQSFYVIGDLSQIITQTYSQDTQNQFIAMDRTIFLNHKNVIPQSVILTYINDQNKTVQITSFDFKQSTKGYNAYIILYQDQKYINTQIRISYQYYIYTTFYYDSQESNQIYFTSYNQYITLKHNNILQDTIQLKRLQNQDEQQTYVNINLPYYYLSSNSSECNSTLGLNFPYFNRLLNIDYYYKDHYGVDRRNYYLKDIGTQISSSSYGLNNSFLTFQQNKYVLNNINNDIIDETIKLTYINYNQQWHAADSYSVQNGIFTFDKNNNILYSEYQLSLMKINYYYNRLSHRKFYFKFENFSTSLLKTYANLTDAKVYYQLQNEIQINLNDYFIFKSGNTVVDPDDGGVWANVKVIVKTTVETQLQQIFSHKLYVSYQNQVQPLYLQLQSIYNDNFNTPNSQNYQLYYLLNNQYIQLPNNVYNISDNRISLVTSSDYTSLLQYVNKTIKVTYDVVQQQSNSYYSTQDAISFGDINDVINLNLQDVSDFSCYYVNEQNQLVQIDVSQYTLNKDNGQFSILDQSLIDKKIFYHCQYKKVTWKQQQVQFIPNSLSSNIQLTSKIASVQDIVPYILYNDSYSFSQYYKTYVITKYSDVQKVDLYYTTTIDEETVTNYLSSSNYTYDKTTQTITIIDNKSFGQINIVVYSKLPSSYYNIVKKDEYVFSVTKNQLVGKTIVLSYNYISNTSYINYSNNVLKDKCNKITITDDIIKNKQRQYYTSFTSETSSSYGYIQLPYDDVQIKLSDITKFQIFYCNAQFSVQNFNVDHTNNKIIIYDDYRNINQYISFKFDTYIVSNRYHTNQDLQFRYYNQQKQLTKNFAYDYQLKIKKQLINKQDGTILDYNALNISIWQEDYDEEYNYYYYQVTYYDSATKEYYMQPCMLDMKLYDLIEEQIIPKTDYIVTDQYNSTITFNNYNLNKQLYLSYYYLQQVSKTKQFTCYQNKFLLYSSNSSQSSSSYNEFLADTLKIYQYIDDKKIAIDSSLYYISSEMNGYYVNLNIDNDQLSNGVQLLLIYDIMQKKYVNDNSNVQYLRFQSYNRNIQLPKGNVSNVTMYYYDDTNNFSLVNTSAYTYTVGIDGNNSVVTMNDDDYLDKRISIYYSTKLQSNIYEKTFTNDRSLTFSSTDSYIILKHSYIDKDTFKMYYQSNTGNVLIDPKYYILDTGSEYFNGVVVLNVDGGDCEQFLNKRLIVYYQYIKNPRKIYNKENEKFPYLSHIYRTRIHQGTKQYISGYSEQQHIGFKTRQQPVYAGDQGVKYRTKLTDFESYQDYQFLYLQNFWDAYNTIHIGGVIDSSNRIILQYAEYGTSQKQQSKWLDFVGIGSTFDEQLNHYIMPQNTKEMFIDTFDDSMFVSGVTYRLRMSVRGSSKSSNGMSQWVYSIPFTIDHEAVNPCNITDILFDSWTKRLKITFRIDDTSGDLYDITGLSYSPNGTEWYSIDLTDVLGNITFLTSNKINAKNIVYHTIIWKAGNYSLKASNFYRIKITANYTKYNQGDLPVFQWKNTINPWIDYYQDLIFKLNGGKQYYIYVNSKLKQIQNSDGTVSYQQLDQQVSYWQAVQPYQVEIQSFVYNQDGTIQTDENGQYVTQTTTETRNYYIVDGEIQQLKAQIQQIKSKPYKTVLKDGSYVTIPWGYRQYYSQDLSTCIDEQGYTKWSREYDTQYNGYRANLINQLDNQIQNDQQLLANYRWLVLSEQIKCRKQLIRQGCYANGFLKNEYNTKCPTPFRFRLSLSYETTLEKEFIQSQGYQQYQLKYQLQIDFLNTFNSQFNGKPLRDCYYYTKSDTTHQIISGIDTESDSTDQVGYFYLNKDYLPGNLKTDTSINDSFSYSYFWRVRPFTCFKYNKRQIPHITIYNIVLKDNIISVKFGIKGQTSLQSLSLPIYYQNKDDYPISTGQSNGSNIRNYCIYVQQKGNRNIISATTDQQLKDFYINPSLSISEFYNSKYIHQPTDVVFATDRLKDSNGYLYTYSDYFSNWISFSTSRLRPCVCIYNNEYYLTYDKPTADGNNTMYLSISKDGNTFGQLEQIYPQNPNQSMQSLSISRIYHGCMIRYKDVFYLFARYVDVDKNNFIALFTSKDLNGDEWSQPFICQSLSDCNYPSVLQTFCINARAYGQKVFVMLVQANSSQYKTNFQFYLSYDLITWTSYDELVSNNTEPTIALNLSINSINISNLKLSDRQDNDYDNIAYLSPFIFVDNNDDVYLYFVVYNTESQDSTYSIYRSKYNGTTWDKAIKIMSNAFNPCVVLDTFYGVYYHRMYYNIKTTVKTNGKNNQQFAIKNVFISSQNVNRAYNKSLVRFYSQQISDYEHTAFYAGDNSKCSVCYGTGKINNQTCTYCNGKGYLSEILYTANFRSDNLAKNISNYNVFVECNKNYNTKLYRKYGGWIDSDYHDATSKQMIPYPKYKFFDV